MPDLRELLVAAVAVLREAEAVGADHRAVLHHDAVAEPAALADLHARVEQAVLADLDVLVEDHVRVDDACARRRGRAAPTTAQGADVHAGAQHGARVDLRGRVDARRRAAAAGCSERDRAREGQVRVVGDEARQRRLLAAGRRSRPRPASSRGAARSAGSRGS